MTDIIRSCIREKKSAISGVAHSTRAGTSKVKMVENSTLILTDVLDQLAQCKGVSPIVMPPRLAS